jgi:hypothetical protein
VVQTAVRLVLLIGDSNPRGKMLWIRSPPQTFGGRALTMGELATFSILQSTGTSVGFTSVRW